MLTLAVFAAVLALPLSAFALDRHEAAKVRSRAEYRRLFRGVAE
jgi:hypothetical protein